MNEDIFDDCWHRFRRLWTMVFSCYVILALATIKTTSGASPEQRFASQPSPQTAMIGSTVVLPCRIINRVGEVQWTRDEFGLGNERELYAFERYQMIGSDEEGDFSLRISPVTLEDNARFQCQVTGWKGVPGVRTQSAKLTVYAPPEPPEILQGPLLTVTAGMGVQLQCISAGGNPAPELQWIDGTGRVMKEGVEYVEEKMESNRYNVSTTLSFLAGSKHHNSLYTCIASSPALNQPASTQTRLEVIYAPEITITTDLPGYREGQTATLNCAAVANPNILTFTWYRNGKQVQASNSMQLVVENVTKASSLEDISCQASNEVGASKKTVRLTIHYGPSFAVPPADQYTELGQKVTLLCEVDSSPEAKILWINQKSQMVVGKGSHLELVVSQETIGRYLCLAKVDGFPEISAPVGVFLKVPPRVECDNEQWGKEGDTIKIECDVVSSSAQSTKVIWTRHGKEINLENERYKVKQRLTTSGLRHTLFIRDAKSTDFGPYNFSAHNDYGSDFFEILLSKTRKLSLIIMIGGVAGGIVFIILVLAVVIICARKSAARVKEAKKLVLPEKTVSFQMNDQNSSSSSSTMKTDVSQRNGPASLNKEAELECWKSGSTHILAPTHISSSKGIINNNNNNYPDTYTAIPIRTNGHLRQKSENYCFANYADHATLMDHQQHQQMPSPSEGFTRSTHGVRKSIGAGLGYRGGLRSSQDLLTTSHYALYPGYEDYGLQEPLEDSQRLSQVFSEGITNPSFKSSCGSLPLSFHVSSRTSVAKGHTPTGRPRLGTCVLPTHYYAPGTQLLNGSLATHV